MPAREDGLRGDLRAQKLYCQGLGDADCRCGARTDAVDPHQRVGRRTENAAEIAEFAEQRLCDRLGVDARDREHQEIFEKLIIAKRIGSAVEQAVAKASTMSCCVGAARVPHGTRR